MSPKKLTKAQRRVLEHLRDNGPLKLWPMEVSPSRPLRQRLVDAGLMARELRQDSMWMWWAITDAGLAALDGLV
jgi:hypothetical protein